MMEVTLLLNATYEPLQIVSWKRAIRMLFQDKVEVIEVYGREIRSVSSALKVPSVIRLLHYVRIRRGHNQVKLSRQSLFARDGYRCQYCGTKKPVAELTYDHVVPVSRGGQKSWENIVTSCVTCNRKKGNRTPEEAGILLKKAPRAPMGFPGRVQLLFSRVKTPECWRTYIFWDHR